MRDWPPEAMSGRWQKLSGGHARRALSGRNKEGKGSTAWHGCHLRGAPLLPPFPPTYH